MKKIIILAFAALSMNVFAQSTIKIRWTDANNAVVAPNSVFYDIASIVGDNVSLNFDITNTSTSTTNVYDVKRYDMSLNTAAEAFFCFGGQCYGAATINSSGQSLTLTPLQSASQVPGSWNTLTADLTEYGTTSGTSIVRYTFINKAVPSDSMQMTITYNMANPVGIKETSKNVSSFEVFPNPAKDVATLRINAPKAFEASSVLLYNSLGEVVYQKNISILEGKNKIDMNVDHLPAGVYFASIKTGDSAISKKLIIN